MATKNIKGSHSNSNFPGETNSQWDFVKSKRPNKNKSMHQLLKIKLQW